MALSLARALDNLYAADPDAFVATRDRLAKELKAAGDVEGAGVVKARRKPTLVAQVLNRVARVHVDDVAAFVDAARDFARAQRRSMRGNHGEVKDALARTRRGLAAVSALADDVLVALGAPSEKRSAEIRAALQAAVANPAAAAAFEEGRLEAPPALATEFAVDAGDDVDLAPRAAPTKTEHKPAEKQPTQAEKKKQAQAEKRAAQAAKKQAQAEQKQAQAEQKKQAQAEKRAAQQQLHAQKKEHAAAAKQKEHAAAAKQKERAEQRRRQQLLDDARALVDDLAAHREEQRAAATALAEEADRKAAEAEAAAHAADAAREDADRADAAWAAAVEQAEAAAAAVA